MKYIVKITVAALGLCALILDAGAICLAFLLAFGVQ